MSGCYLDTTILVDYGQQTEPRFSAALKHTKANEPVQVPDYAYRELLAGKVAAVCNAHNAVVAADNIFEVVIAFVKRGAFGRTARAQAEDILRPLKERFDAKASLSPKEAKREVVEALMMAATKIWKRANKYPLAKQAHPLPCFANGPVTLDKNGLLRGPNESFGCAMGAECGAAQWMFADRAALKKMILALDSKSLPDAIRLKPENRSRRRVLKRLEERGPKYITKGFCRKLGDAYFAAMCPPGAHVLTTNVVDFEPLCNSLGKAVKAV